MSGQVGNVLGVFKKTVQKLLNSEQVEEIILNYINMEHARKNSTIETEVEKENVTREQAEENKKLSNLMQRLIMRDLKKFQR